MSNPTIQRTRVELLNLKLYSYHGVFAQERRVGNDYSVSLAVDYNATIAAATDSVNAAINYATLAEIVQSEMAIPTNLLETVAHRIVQRICREFSAVTAGYVTITKLMPPMGVSIDGSQCHSRIHSIAD